ncbi:citrate lyase acyl carrier protein [Clostridium sp. KNHs214]|uniref:citrate lyase acyl carrier protein n=1 Tax=Clostridium sp. KNHs214 TaxID=1540257 RepID=UPI0005564351|nr:citrate lyase acyl carrier protein [Clostridium sp. KNHs214]
MKIEKVAKAGTLESNDVMITVMPNVNGGIEVEIDSIVMKQFGEAIKETIMNTLKELKVEEVKIKAEDKGALDYTIKARIETAIKRATN